MDIRAVNFVATVIGWAVLIIGAIALLAWGIDSAKLSLSEGQRFVALLIFFGVILLGGLYLASLDWFRDKDKNERWLEESRSMAERRHEQEMERLQHELHSTRIAMNEALDKAKPAEKPRAQPKPKQ